MMFHFFFIFVLLNFAFGGGYGTVTREELHWISIFPHTPIPKVLQQILPTPGQSINVTEFGAKWYGGNSEDEFENDKRGFNPEIGVFSGYNLFSGYDLFTYSVKEPKTEDIDPTKKVNRKALGRKSSHKNTDIKETIFFFRENLLSGTKVNLPRLLAKSNMVTFLPQQIAESMPLSNENLPQIMKNFSLQAESKGANDVKVVVRNCERDGMKGETKYCATSFESFVDLGVSVLGKHIQILSHELGKHMKSPLFTIGQGLRKMGENNLVCHKMKYPYAVYMCHSIEKTEVYKVPLVNKDGTKANVVAVCHKDTSTWSPNHIAFKLLEVKPGTVPICHFLGRDTLVWIDY